jgi:hypothetical protein
MAADCMSASQLGQSRSGSIAENPKYDGDSSDDMKYDGDKSNSGNNLNIGKTGWGS